MPNVTIKLDNNQPLTAGGQDLNIMITGKPPKGGQPINLSGLTLGVSTKWSDFISGNSAQTISFDYMDSGRLYYGYGNMNDAPEGSTDQPVPYWGRYYGVIEFAYVPGDDGIYLDITDVNLVALPISITGTTSNGMPFKLGYKTSADDMRTALITNNINDGSGCVVKKWNNQPPTAGDLAAVITCRSGNQKIVSPTAGTYRCYNYSFDSYITSLRNDKTPIIIVSDAGTDSGETVTFTGSFTTGDNVVELTGSNGDTLNIPATVGGDPNFSNGIIYQCDGGKVSYNGHLIAQNYKAGTNSPLTADQVIYSNSTTRNIFIGMNEGRFVPSTTQIAANEYANWATMKPWPGTEGNQYAKYVYENCNAYGYPYADKFLSALVIADISDPTNNPIVISSCPNNKPCNYGGSNPSGTITSDYLLTIGPDSVSNMGDVKIESADGTLLTIIKPNQAGTYSGNIPTTSGWNKILFSTPNKYILYQTSPTPQVIAQDGSGATAIDCLYVGDPSVLKPGWQIGFTKNTATGKYTLGLGDHLKWNDKASSPAIPS